MANKKPNKVSAKMALAPKATPKKVSKTASKNGGRGVAKSVATPRPPKSKYKHYTTPPSKKERNEIRYKRDLDYIAGKLETPLNRKTKYGDNAFDYEYRESPKGRRKYYVNKTNPKHKLSVEEYQRTVTNPSSVPHFIPIKENGKTVAFRNTITGERVSSYYRYQVLGKRLKQHEDESYRYAYEASQNHYKQVQSSKRNDLITSYQRLHPKMTRQEIIKDDNFINLVIKLEQFTIDSRTFNEEYWEQVDAMVQSTYPTKDEIKKQTRAITRAVNDSQEFKDVLAQLGRRLSTETFPVGDSDPNHIKNVVIPALNRQAPRLKIG
jgi:hypothetical protein